MEIEHPLYNHILVSADRKETLMIRSVITISSHYYVIFIPLVTEYPLSSIMDIDEDTVREENEFLSEIGEFEEAIGFGEVVFDYEEKRAYIHPLDPLEDGDLIVQILSILQQSYTY